MAACLDGGLGRMIKVTPLYTYREPAGFFRGADSGSSLVDSGHEPGTDVHADEEGFIVCHDGSVTDRFHRAGVPYTAAIETTTETPWPLADEINLIWIRGFIDLAAAAA